MIQGWHGQTVKSISGRQANHIGICPQTTQNFAEKIAGQDEQDLQDDDRKSLPQRILIKSFVFFAFFCVQIHSLKFFT